METRSPSSSTLGLFTRVGQGCEVAIRAETSTNRSLMTGELQSVDGYMNIALEKTEEYVNGVKRRTYGDAFVRGNNGESGGLHRM